MGEAALTSHAGGAGHKAAVRKLVEGSLASILKWGKELKKHGHNCSEVFVSARYTH